MPENLLIPGDESWNKWFCPGKTAWITFDFKGETRHIEKIVFRSANDWQPRDPDEVWIYRWEGSGWQEQKHSLLDWKSSARQVDYPVNTGAFTTTKIKFKFYNGNHTAQQLSGIKLFVK